MERSIRVVVFSNQYFIGIFGTGLISFKGLDAVISLGEVSEGSIVFRIFSDGSVEIGNTFWGLATEVGVTYARAILGGAFSIHVIVSIVSEMISILSRLKEQLLTQSACTNTE
jgi:hypothetical protein